MNKEDILKQEEVLQFSEFKNSDALNIALSIIKKVKKEGLKPVGIRVVYNGSLLFHYLMDGKRDSPWLNRKEKTVLDSGHCSLYTFYAMEENAEYESWSKSQDYALCGGGFPIIEQGEVKGAICVSGLEHTEDHRVLINTLEEYLKK